MKIFIGILCIIAAIVVIVGIYNRNRFLDYIDQEVDLYDYIDDNNMVGRSKIYKELSEELEAEIERLKACRTSEELNDIKKNIDIIENKIIANEIITNSYL